MSESFLTLRIRCQYFDFTRGVGILVTAVYTACHIPFVLAIRFISLIRSGANPKVLYLS